MSQRENSGLNQPGDPERVDTHAPAQRTPREQDEADLRFDQIYLKADRQLDQEYLVFRASRSEESARRHRRNEWSKTLRTIAEAATPSLVAGATYIASQVLGLSAQEAITAAGVAIAAASAGAVARRVGRRR
ncbi:hypothetical protein DFJ67_2987 [Asanoa ferruginea]|uniref:Uncharacterized protein n=1 Tax=Asanoa ferruginea TaxID=53367 RepID=A0A3D9ZKH7_9ACTN|nr:hypothetical protein [Asanoa ferruginea]REF96992.1 hypothetical protein DFJ67_2987 [Asanoa ferruginea]GIF50182.1 hypothetical protein Afe04nite_47210 [Asanoa ferruginea]